MKFMLLWTRKDMIHLCLLFALAASVLGFQLGKTGLLDPDEPFYSLTAKEMLEANDPWTPRMFGEPQFEKPIFFYWVLYASFKFLGISEFSARLGPCIAGILTVLVVYLWGRILFKRGEPAFISAAILATSGQFIVLSRIVLTDIFLCLFVTAALTFFSWGYAEPARRKFAWRMFFVFAGFGFLTKGPLGLFIPLSGVLVYAAAAREFWILKSFPWRSGLLLFSLIGLPWYILMAKTHGLGFLDHFFIHENIRRFFVAEHRGMDRWYFYPGVFLLGFFPWSAFAAAGFSSAMTRAARGRLDRPALFLLTVFLVPFCFFMFAKSKLMSYIFPLYPVAALLAGVWGWKLYRSSMLGYRPAGFTHFLNAVVWGLAPAVLAAGAYFFAADQEVPIFFPLGVISLTVIPLLWAALFLFNKKKMTAAFLTALSSVVIFSVLSFGWMLPQAAKVFSSKRWAEDYGNLSGVKKSGIFLGSKMFVRGMTYYAGLKNVGVFSGQPNGGFYTPHPIPIFSNAKELLDIKEGRFPVYLLIRKKELRHLREGLEPGFSISVLEQSPFRTLVRLDHV